jgi:hypothetical protein
MIDPGEIKTSAWVFFRQAGMAGSPLTRSIFTGRRQTFGSTGRALWWSGTSRCRVLVGHGGTPALLGEIDGASLIRGLAKHMSEWDEALPLERRLMAVASSMTCHGSGARGAKAQAAGDERASARDGGGAEFRPM